MMENCLSCSRDTLNEKSISDHKITPISTSELNLNLSSASDPLYEKIPEIDRESTAFHTDQLGQAFDVQKYILGSKGNLAPTNFDEDSMSNSSESKLCTAQNQAQNDLNKKEPASGLNVSLSNMNNYLTF